MTRLLIDATPVGPEAKGVGRYAYHVCLQLATRLPQDWSLQALIHQEALRLFPPGFSGELTVVPRTSEVAGAVLSLRKCVRKAQPQILLKTHESAGYVAGVPTVTICHDIDRLILEAQKARRHPLRSLIDGAKLRLRRRALQNSDFVICNSQFTRSAVQRYYRIPAGKTAVAYCAVDPRFYEFSTTVDKTEVRRRYGVRGFILALATGDPRENHQALPAIAARLGALNVPVCLLIAGTRPGRPYVDELRSRFRDVGLAEGRNYIFESFLGADRFSELVELYASADFYLDLSLHEGFGMQLAEAMACGTTCITSPNGALAEIGDGHVVFADPTNPGSVAEAIRNSYESRLHLRDNSEQVRYTHKFCWDDTGKVIAEVLLRLAAGARKSAA